MKIFWSSLLLAAILASIFFRLYHLGEIPTGLHADEASYGYDAYSVLLTGHDVWGQKLPLVFKSFGEYKLNLPYLIAPAVAYFGLGTLATRLPSALAGLATCLILYLTLERVSRRSRQNLLLTLIFATSPWAFGLSRLFFESNVALFFFALGFYGLYRPNRYSSPALALAGYFYAPFRFLSLVVLGLGLWRAHWSRRSLFIFLLISLPILPHYFSDIGLKRLEQESALRRFEHELVINENRALCGHKLCYAFWNKPLFRLESTVQTFLAEFSPHYLFFDTADAYIVPPSTGPYLLYLTPFYLWGLYLLVKKPDQKFWLTWGAALMIAASASKLSLYRNPAGLYLAYIPVALGVAALAKFSRPLFTLFVISALFSQVRFLSHYFLIYSTSPTFAWGSDSEYIARYIGRYKDEYRTIVDKSAGDFGPLYYAFYNAIDPELFRARAEWTTGDPAGWTHVGKLGHIASHDDRSIENLLCEKASAPQDDLSLLYITTPLPDYSRFADHTTYDLRGEKVLHEFYDLDSLFDQLLADNPANLTRLCPRETARW